MRDAIRSGWNSSSASDFSPVPMKSIGLPVTCLTDRAAPPRASPSALVRITPVKLKCLIERLGGVHRVLTRHAVDDEEPLVGIERGFQLSDFGHHFGVDVQAPGRIEQQHVIRLQRRLGERTPGDRQGRFACVPVAKPAPTCEARVCNCRMAAGR